jgi:alkylglycerol monooxygenase
MNVYAYITPIVLLLLITEILVSVLGKKRLYTFQDTVANIGTGIGNQCVNLAVVFLVMKWYGWLWQFAPWRVPETWYYGLLLLLISDFIFYWFHRIGHTLNIFWAAHMPHHSSEEFNLSVGVRASFTQRLFQFMFFDWVLVLLGFSPDMVYAVAGIHLLIAYWHHTRLINKMGWVEKVFVTPAHHRVHHGVNPQYLDKNFSEFLIIWDRMFGTYAPEEEEVCYGLTHPPRTWDPIYINIQFWKQLVEDCIAAPYWWDKLRIWFMPLGWRPRGLETPTEKKRIGYTKAEQVKYQSQQLRGVKPYLIVQIVLALAVLMLTTNLKLPLAASDRLLLSGGIFAMIIAWGGLLRARKWAGLLEILRIVVMAVSLAFVLDRSGMAPWMGWSSIVIFAAAGGSILGISMLIIRGQLEGENVPAELSKAG